MALVWTVSLLCWSAAALLIASLTFPDIFKSGGERDPAA